MVTFSLIVSTLFFAVACKEKKYNSTLEKIRAENELILGFANEAPYAYRDIDSDRLTGESPEIARYIAEQMGIEEIDGVLTEFGSLIPALKAGRVDVIAAGMYITPERCEEVLFSEPTYSIGEAFLVKSGNPEDLHSYSDIKENPSLRLGVVSGAIQRKYALKTGIPESQLIMFQDHPGAVEGLVAGRIDAYAGTELTVNDMLSKMKNKAIEKAEPFNDPVIDGETVRGYGAFAFRKDSEKLQQKFNAILEDFIGTEKHRQMVQKFGFSGDKIPEKYTTEYLCSN